jgi:hypothetical protein
MKIPLSLYPSEQMTGSSPYLKAQREEKYNYLYIDIFVPGAMQFKHFKEYSDVFMFLIFMEENQDISFEC